jgi:hypothetical protein
VPAPNEWGTCRHCGRAVPFSVGICPSCGMSDVVTDRQIPLLPKWHRRRVRLAQGLRVFIVVGVIVALAAALLDAVWTGPTTFADPLTTQGTYTLAPGNDTILSGWITGEDYIDGNYSVVSPVGTVVVLEVFNSSSFEQFVQNEPATPQWVTTNDSAAPIIFAAPYTDMFYFVFENPYNVGSGIVQTIYITTQYESNVVIG